MRKISYWLKTELLLSTIGLILSIDDVFGRFQLFRI